MSGGSGTEHDNEHGGGERGSADEDQDRQDQDRQDQDRQAEDHQATDAEKHHPGTDDQATDAEHSHPGTDHQATDAERNHDNEEAGDPDRGGAAGPRPDPSDDPSAESDRPGMLSPAMGGPPQRPPRRTGVFLDPDDLRDHVGGLLRAILGGYEVDGFGNFTFQHEGARAFVTVGPSPIGPQVGVFSVTNLDLDLSHPLASFLLTTNHKLGFGAFSYDEDNRAVWLRHTLLGSTLDLPELQSAVAAVATTAAALDETIRDRFGGRTFSEAPADVQQHLEPPNAAGSARPPNASGYL